MQAANSQSVRKIVCYLSVQSFAKELLNSPGSTIEHVCTARQFFYFFSKINITCTLLLRDGLQVL